MRTPFEFTYQGKTYRSRRELARAAGIPEHTFCNRLRAGWPIRSAIETPLGQGRE